MKTLVIIILSVLCTGTLSAADDGSIEYPSVEAALQRLKNQPAANISTQGGWTIISLVEEGHHVIWFFSPQEHDAYPAMVKRTYLEKDGGIEIVTTTSCQAPKKKCDALAEQFSKISGNIK